MLSTYEVSAEQQRAEHEARILEARADRLSLVGALGGIAAQITGTVVGGDGGGKITQAGTAASGVFGALAENYRRKAAQTEGTPYDAPRIQEPDPGTGSPGGAREGEGIFARYGAWIVGVAVVSLVGITKLMRLW